MRSKWFLLVAAMLATAVMAAPAAAQTISYINLLQFDLVSYRSQATAGMHDDDIEKVANAARLLEIDGHRLFTSFANLSDPATLGDNLITYSKDHTGNPTTSDMFDTGSYLGGWIGKYDNESDYVFSVFYQRNHNRMMFQDLESGDLGFNFGFSNDAEFAGTFVDEFDDGSGGNDDEDQNPDRTVTDVWDLMRYDDRSAMNFDFGAAKEVSSDLSVGGRISWEKDVLDRFAEGTVETIDRQKFDVDGPLVITDRDVVRYMGDGEEAYKNSEMGISLNADYHAWSNQSFNVRLDIFGTNLTNPAISDPLSTRGTSYDNPAGYGVNFVEDTDYDPVTTDAGQFPNNPTLGSLVADHENSSVTTGSYRLYDGPFGGAPVYSVDDERTGVGFSGLLEYDRDWAGGQARGWAGFTRRPYDLDAKVVLKEYERDTFWWNGGAGDRMATFTNFENTETLTRSGDMTVSGWELGSRWNREMNQNVSFGCGIILTRNTWKEEYTETSVFESITDWFDDGDAADNALFTFLGSDPTADEGRVVSTSTFARDVVHEVRTTTTRLPVGVTFRWGDGGRYGWNMGATHNLNNQTIDTEAKEASTGRTVTVTNYVGDTTGNGTTYSSNTETVDATLTDKNRWNTTTYFYGFEWRPTEAAQINVNGFLDTHGDSFGNTSPPFTSGRSIGDVDFWRNMAVSMTFFFM